MNRINKTSRTGGISSAKSGTTASARLDQQNPNRATGLAYRAYVAAPRPLFAAPPVDLTTLVIAEEIRRKAQAERQREALRDVAYQYDMPMQYERNDPRKNERSGRINPADADE